MPTAPIKVLDNVDELLGVLGSTGPLVVPDIAKRMSIPRSSVYRLVDAAVHAGLVHPHGDGTMALAPALVHLAERAFEQNPLISAARPILEALRDEVGETVYLCARRGEQTICLLRYQGLHVGLMELVPGGILPPHAGATARVITAFDDELLARTADGPLPRLTPQTIHAPEELIARSRAVRTDGYVLSDEDVTQGVAAVGVPVWDGRGRLRGAISAAGMRDHVIAHVRPTITALQAASTAITRALP